MYSETEYSLKFRNYYVLIKPILKDKSDGDNVAHNHTTNIQEHWNRKYNQR